MATSTARKNRRSLRVAGAGGGAAAKAAKGEALPDLSAPELYLNRELTWLSFNSRVLHEAEDERTPLLERVKFLAITGSNLDEFFMKRVGGLKQQVAAGVQRTTVDGRTPQQQLVECYEVVRDQQRRQQGLIATLRALLREHGILLLAHGELSRKEQRAVRDE
ncbi:MAG: RNA degradosome polyphosphate kinase, partial [Proteobacteria bacterium]|nr:RNA degradosome polyphosphate kinase [Pseudomonadota bacterium]